MLKDEIIYDKQFSEIYNEYGWDYFSLTMGNAILEFLEKNKIKIKNHIDLCCGTGTLCDLFYNNKIKTEGIDISEHMISLAKEKNKNINYYVYNVLKFHSKEKYDLITLTCDAINHLTDNNNIDILFKNISSMLNDNGYLIFDMYDDNIKYNTELISKRENNINVHYYITKLQDKVNTNVKVKENEKVICEKDVIEKIYDKDYIKNKLYEYDIDLVQVEKSIGKEKQRFEDKLYFICKKNKGDN